MSFSWGELAGFVSVAIVFVVIKKYFEKKEDEKFFSPGMLVEILALGMLLQVSDWIFS